MITWAAELTVDSTAGNFFLKLKQNKMKLFSSYKCFQLSNKKNDF